MGIIRNPIPVKLIIGMLSPDRALFDACSDVLCREYGPIDLQSEVLPWSNTDYYRDEMGPGIVRKFIIFEHLIDAEALPTIKVLTNSLEKTFAKRSEEEFRRTINLDPGYVTEAKVVLATTKDFAHRIYIGKGIYAEATLIYSAGSRSFAPVAHTYPDYRTDAGRSLFNAARTLLRKQLNKDRPRKR